MLDRNTWNYLCTIAIIWLCETYMECPLRQNIKHLTTSLFRYESFHYLLSLKVLRHKERHNLSILAFSSAPHPKHVWHLPQRSPRASENQPSSPEAGLISTNWLFQNLPKSSVLFRCVTSPALRNPASNVYYCDISEWHVPSARAWTPVLMLHLTNLCAKPKGSQPN